MTISLGQIAALVSGELVGDPETPILGISSIGDAKPGDVVFAESARLLQDAERSQASAVITRKNATSGTKPVVKVSNPRVAFATVLDLFSPQPEAQPGIHPSAFIDPSADIAADASIGFCARIGRNVQIGSGCVVHPFAFVGSQVTMGEGCVIHPHVTLYPHCEIGSRVVIHAGSVIGSDGFGYNFVDGQHQKVTHIGGVKIGDDVEIGANVTVDRARTGYTEIGSGTKIDNLVHVAHNVTIGRNCILVAQVGISGSVTIGNCVTLAGQAGVKDHVSIGDGSVVAARAGIISDIPEGSKIAGFPARPYGEEMRVWASVGHLPEILRQMKALQKRVDELEKGAGGEGEDA